MGIENEEQGTGESPRSRTRVLKLTGIINADINGGELLVTFNRPLTNLERAGLVQVIQDSIA